MIMVDKSKRHRTVGRPKVSEDTKDKVVIMYNDNKSIEEICKESNLSRSTIYKIIRERSVSI